MFSDWLTPQLVKTFSSPFNSKIELIKFAGSYRLDMGELTQSGHVIETIWDSAFKKLLPPDFTSKSVLILGLCCGSVAKLIANKWPQSSITGLEIDPVVVDIARTYFHLDKLKNLEIVNADAIKYVENLDTNAHFDLAIVDCYLGYQIPHQFENPSFLQNLKKHTNHLLLNRLFWEEHKTASLEFLSRLTSTFTVSTCRTPSNLVISLDPA
mgnify:CR=1 FL=1